MPRPKRGTLAEKSPYRFQGYVDGDGQWVSALVQCEEEGNHRITPKTWPPPRTGHLGGADPSLNARCELCGAWLIVYEGHATGAMQSIDVVLTEEQKKRSKISA